MTGSMNNPEMNKEKQKGLMHLISALRWSWNGLCSAIRDEAAFRQELVFFVLLSPAAIWLGETAIEYILLIGSLFLVLIVELLNTAVEATVNRISSEWHDLSKKAKDVGSAAVMLTIIHAIFIWTLILYKHAFE